MSEKVLWKSVEILFLSCFGPQNVMNTLVSISPIPVPVPTVSLLEA